MTARPDSNRLGPVPSVSQLDSSGSAGREQVQTVPDVGAEPTDQKVRGLTSKNGQGWIISRPRWLIVVHGLVHEHDPTLGCRGSTAAFVVARGAGRFGSRPAMIRRPASESCSPEPNSSARSAATSPPPRNTANTSSKSSSCSPPRPGGEALPAGERDGSTSVTDPTLVSRLIAAWPSFAFVGVYPCFQDSSGSVEPTSGASR